MASSSAAQSFIIPNVAHLVYLKLFDNSIYLMWLSLLEPNLISNDLMGIVDGTEPCPSKYLPVSLAPGAAPESSPDKAAALLNPAYTLWVKRDQFTRSWINSTLSESVLSTVYGLRPSHLVWTFLASKFASQTRTRIAQLQRELQTLQQGSTTCGTFINTAQQLAHQLAAVGTHISDAELTNYIIGGLHPSYNSFVTLFSLLSRAQLLSFDDFQAELLSFEHLLNAQQQRIAPEPSMALLSAKPSSYHFNKKQQTPSIPQQFSKEAFYSTFPLSRFFTANRVLQVFTAASFIFPAFSSTL
jgi:hypothetical protein